MAFRVCSTGHGYPQLPPDPDGDGDADDWTYSRPHVITAYADMVIPHHPITKMQFASSLNHSYPAGLPGNASTAYYNVVTGKNDLALVVTASSTHTTAGHEPWRIINTEVNDQWWSMPGLYDAAGLYIGAQTEGGEWVQISYPYPVCIFRYVMILYGGSLAIAGQFPKRWKIMATVDGTTWETIVERTADFDWVRPWDGQRFGYEFTNVGARMRSIKAVKIVFTKVCPNQSYLTLATPVITGCQCLPTH
jgi:hypothetical protein